MSRRVLGGVAIVASAVLLTGSTAVAAPVGSSPVDTSADNSGGNRVLQSIAVDMSPDGTLTKIDGTVVRDDAGEPRTTDESYSPGKVSGELPVRVLTAYRTEDRSGTDLTDLEGYTGRVRIDLTVQNLTVHPENLTYDVDGFSRTQPALVGAPLTLIASAALRGTRAASVVTGDHGAQSATNGVLSKSQDGTTQVQWATILAPPQLDSSATLSLVVNARHFSVPDFDLSVQPGLVTDPSVGNLIDAAFNPARSNELQLETRTIALIADVNSVLDRASGTIARVRRTLSGAARTLGTRTVSDLQASTVGIASAVKGLSGSVNSLGGDLSSSLKSTKSTTVAELAQIVQAVDKSLGDTSMKAPKAKVDANGCKTTVNAPKQADSVYGNLLEVVSQLNGYAEASDKCQQIIGKSLTHSVGPEAPTEADCQAEYAGSTTCILFGTKEALLEQSAKLGIAQQSVVGGLDDLGTKDAVTNAKNLDTAIADVITEINRLDSQHSSAYSALRNLADAVSALQGSLSGKAQHLEAYASEGLDEAGGTANPAADSMTAENAAAAAQVCTMLQDPTLSQNQQAVKQLEGVYSLLTDQDCTDDAGSVVYSPKRPILFPTYPAALSSRIADQATRWANIKSDTVPGDTEAERWVELDQSLDALGDLIEKATKDLTTPQTDPAEDSDLPALIQELKDAANQRVYECVPKNPNQINTPCTLKELADRVNTSVDGLGGNARNLIESVNNSFADAQGAISTLTDPKDGKFPRESKRLADQAQDLKNGQLADLFESSRNGLNRAADAITANGKKTIGKQRGQFAAQQEAAARHIGTSIEKGLGEIAKGVTSSTRDMKAANTLLQRDLRKVLLDLGQRKVHGSGLLGSMATGAATAGSADYQLALATRKSSSYANVRSGDIAGLMLRQAQADAAMRRLAELPPFALQLDQGTQHQTVYTFHLGSAK